MSNNEWQTPQWLFDELNEEFNFDIDLCATKTNKKCDSYYTDYLNNTVMIRSDKREYWYREEGLCIFKDAVCFMNPPYSDLYPFIVKAWKDSLYCNIVLLLPAKTDTKWWRIFWNINRHKPKVGCQVRFIPYKKHHPSRIAFINPETKVAQKGNPCGTAIVIFDRRTF